jgi:hypothetical protein
MAGLATVGQPGLVRAVVCVLPDTAVRENFRLFALYPANVFETRHCCTPQYSLRGFQRIQNQWETQQTLNYVCSEEFEKADGYATN